MAKFFIHRPIFAWVVAIFIVLVGVISMRLLPVAAYPSVAPPTINVTASYPGADAATIDETVNSLIEREMNGVDGLMYMSSSALAVGSGTVTLTFAGHRRASGAGGRAKPLGACRAAPAGYGQADWRTGATRQRQFFDGGGVSQHQSELQQR